MQGKIILRLSHAIGPVKIVTSMNQRNRRPYQEVAAEARAASQPRNKAQGWILL